MVFARPVDTLFPIKAQYGDRSARYEWSIDRDIGLWIPIQYQGAGDHNGIDFDCPIGTIVRAMSDGMIVRSRYENYLASDDGAGLFILQIVTLLGYDSWVLKYSHIKASYVKPGQAIKRGEAIAESGMSGNAISPYLHVDLMNLHRQWQPIPIEN